MPKNDRTIDGFYFETDELYEEAHKEKLAVAYLSKQVDLSDNKQALRLYQQAASQKLFSTVIGLTFLRDIEFRLKKDESIPKDQIMAVTVPLKERPPEKPSVSISSLQSEEGTSKKERQKKDAYPFNEKTEAGKYRRRFHGALAFVFILLATIGVMFFITLSSDLPTIVNYRTRLNNEYASWDEELKEREAALDLREKELMEREMKNQSGVSAE
ncbi:MAG: hypothetical protein IJJ79_01880 [Lachnospiraceae bacterium]|nr:hypothetical protein [Lachnospiraceae bacterium]